ncbi:hypothetical protein EDC01DRAFT_636280 [Geopyxis carbonaria]|nr:hypothetical protein EDC01DRAFT_636280 [Geopyxis carbonaria]
MEVTTATTTLYIHVSDGDLYRFLVYRVDKMDPYMRNTAERGTATEKQVLEVELPTRHQLIRGKEGSKDSTFQIGRAEFGMGPNGSEIRASVFCDREEYTIAIRVYAPPRMKIKVVIQSPGSGCPYRLSASDTKCFRNGVFRHMRAKTERTILVGYPEITRMMTREVLRYGTPAYLYFYCDSDPNQLIHNESLDTADTLFPDSFWPLSEQEEPYDSEEEADPKNNGRFGHTNYARARKDMLDEQHKNCYYHPMALDGVPSPARVKWQRFKNQVREMLGVERITIETRKQKMKNWKKKRTAEYNRGDVWRPKFWRTWLGWDKKYKIAYEDVLRVGAKRLEE